LKVWPSLKAAPGGRNSVRRKTWLTLYNASYKAPKDKKTVESYSFFRRYKAGTG
jgi:hypothetical protein